MCSVAALCGGSLPPSVLSYHSLMVLQFTSDGSIARRGFSATLTFISNTGVSTNWHCETVQAGTSWL